MKRFAAVMFSLVALAQAPKDALVDLTWIAGAWGGAMGRAQVEEHWLNPAGGAMLGVSRTIAGERMTAFEFLRIEKRGTEIFYVAQPQGRPATDFKLTSSSPAKAVFENPQHDFPKMITYERESDGTLAATISGGEGPKARKVTFRMKRIAPSR